MKLILNLNITPRSGGLALATLGLLSAARLGAEADAVPTGTPANPASVERLEAFEVIGTPDRIFEIPGSASLIDAETLERFGYDNIDQAIRRVPGAYFRTEDGFGLFPNISLRGIGSMRTSNLTIMEDGILSAPAPYANPAAYYTPTTGRMRGIEVIKGSSQVRYGPQITGGAINYLSTAIPEERSGYLRMLYGEKNEFRNHSWYGETLTTDHGRVGYLAEVYFRRTDGFKHIDGTAASNPSDATGFTKFEPMLKVFWEPETANYNRLEVKVGYTDLDADETYLGVTTADFRAGGSNRRYATSRFDNIATEQIRTSLKHIVDFTPETRASTTAYFNDFTRSWYKIHDVNAGDGNTSLSEALGDPASPELAVLRGQRQGSFRVRNNNREYRAYGVQTFIEHDFETGALDHRAELGIRLHEDYEDRFQEQDTFNQNAFGGIERIDFGRPGSQDNRRGTATALAVSLRDEIRSENWTFTPGLRYEHIRFKNEQRGRVGSTDVPRTERASLDVFGGGLGAQYRLNENNTIFANAFRGFATPSPSAATGDRPIKEETSDAFEIGYRLRDRDQAFQAEVIFFLTNFNDLIVPNNIGGAGVGDGGAENVGKARTYGTEVALRYDPGVANDWTFRMPSFVAFTYTDAELRNDVDAGGGGGGPVESIFAGGRKGAELPYVPDYQVSFGTGIEHGPLGLYADAFYVTSTFGTASNTSSERRPDGTPDARFGKNDSYFLLDLSARYAVHPGATFLLGANNVLDREYIASRLPHGPRPGQPRFVYAGAEFRF